MTSVLSLDVEPTTICNLNCPFCFGPSIEKVSTELDIEIWKHAFIQFQKIGVENIVISGGEPLLYKHIYDYVSFLKKLNFNIVLSTHGRMKDRLLKIAPFCDWISLPIDGFSNELSFKMRTDDYSNVEIIETVKLLKQKFKGIKIKIGTVATAPNIKEITEIANYLSTYAELIDTWKIYQYTPRRKHEKLQSEYLISDLEFNNLKEEIQASYPGLNVFFSSQASRKNAYVFIYHNGEVNLVNIGDDNSDKHVGNIKEFDKIDFQKILSTLEHTHIANFNNTYSR